MIKKEVSQLLLSQSGLKVSFSSSLSVVTKP